MALVGRLAASIVSDADYADADSPRRRWMAARCRVVGLAVIAAADRLANERLTTSPSCWARGAE